MKPLAPFAITRLPRIIFGNGALTDLPKEAARLGRNGLIVTGARSLRASALWPALLDALRAADLVCCDIAVPGEPSPELVDRAVAAFAGKGVDVVIGIGGGSALDAAKAIAGLLPHGNSVMEHLEGVGPEKSYSGPSTPLVLVPTTAGTGSEATKNAVLSRQGADGFKKSFRDEQLVARVAIVDPELLATCPPEVMAANGMDAFTQLLESYVSTKANPMTDALAWSGIEAFRDGFFAAHRGGTDEEARGGRSRMAYAALVSGISLAQTGLGSVHGLASPLGAQFPIPHGVCCGTLVAEATRINVRALRERASTDPALAKYAAVGDLLAGGAPSAANKDGSDRLIDVLSEWTERLGLPRLSTYGMSVGDIAGIVAGSRGSSMKTNPVVLGDWEIAEVLAARL